MTDRHTFKTGLLAVDINVEEAVNENFEVVMNDDYFDDHDDKYDNDE